MRACPCPGARDLAPLLLEGKLRLHLAAEGLAARALSGDQLKEAPWAPAHRDQDMGHICAVYLS